MVVSAEPLRRQSRQGGETEAPTKRARPGSWDVSKTLSMTATLHIGSPAGSPRHRVAYLHDRRGEACTDMESRVNRA
jgi:hypothetical protein